MVPVPAPEAMAELAAERDGYRRVSVEAMRLMSDDQLAELFRRMEDLDQEVSGERPDPAVHPA